MYSLSTLATLCGPLTSWSLMDILLRLIPLGGTAQKKKKRSFALSRRWQTTQRPKDLQQNGTNKQNALLQQFIMWKWKLKWQQQMEQGASNKTNYFQTNPDNPRKTHFFTRCSSSFFLFLLLPGVFSNSWSVRQTPFVFMFNIIYLYLEKKEENIFHPNWQKKRKNINFLNVIEFSAHARLALLPKSLGIWLWMGSEWCRLHSLTQSFIQSPQIPPHSLI